MEFDKEIKSNIEVGDIIETNCGLRMVVKDDYKYSTIKLDGNVSVDWSDSIETLVKGYGVTSVYKNKDLKIIQK